MKKIYLTILFTLAASVGMSWATPNSIVINGTPQVGDNSISLTYYFDPANVPGITGYAPTLKVKCVTDNNWDEKWLSLSEISSGTETINLSTLGTFQEGKSYDVCFAYYNGSWVDEVFQSFTANVYTVAGSSTAVFGTAWAPTLATNDMVYDSGDGLYHFTKNNVELAAGSISFKVVKNHSWDEAYPAQDYVFNIATAGIHNITITFNESTKEVIANDELVEEEVILPVVKVAGNFVDDGWGANAVVLTPALDNLTASGAVTIPNADSFELKVVVGDDWKTVSDVSNWLTRVNNEDVFSFTGGTGNNTHIDMDMVGEYTFTYTFATGALTIAYPQTYTRHFEHAYYSTICLPQAAVLTNAEAYTITSVAGHQITLSAPVNGLVAGTPYIIKPDADDVDVIATMSGEPTANTVAGANGLWGVLNIDGASKIAAGNYILSGNEFHLVEAGATVNVPRFRGALWSDVVLAPELRIIEANNGATNIQNVEGNETAVKFIENGKLFIRKNGVVYDATGAVVK